MSAGGFVPSTEHRQSRPGRRLHRAAQTREGNPVARSGAGSRGTRQLGPKTGGLEPADGRIRSFSKERGGTSRPTKNNTRRNYRFRLRQPKAASVLRNRYSDRYDRPTLRASDPTLHRARHDMKAWAVGRSYPRAAPGSWRADDIWCVKAKAAIRGSLRQAT